MQPRTASTKPDTSTDQLPDRMLRRPIIGLHHIGYYTVVNHAHAQGIKVEDVPLIARTDPEVLEEVRAVLSITGDLPRHERPPTVAEQWRPFIRDLVLLVGIFIALVVLIRAQPAV